MSSRAGPKWQLRGSSKYLGSGTEPWPLPPNTVVQYIIALFPNYKDYSHQHQYIQYNKEYPWHHILKKNTVTTKIQDKNNRISDKPFYS